VHARFFLSNAGFVSFPPPFFFYIFYQGSEKEEAASPGTFHINPQFHVIVLYFDTFVPLIFR
jgi:hypothetical protein